VTAGTVFHRTRIPLRTWFWAIFFVARHKKGISALQLQRDTGLGSYQTAWTPLHKLRSALGPRPEVRLRGLVEVDESYVGGPERGRRGGREVLHKSIVAAAVERRRHTAGRARLSVIEGVSFEDDLGPFVRGAIDARRATVRTDGFSAYFGLEAQGVRHDRRGSGPRSCPCEEDPALEPYPLRQPQDLAPGHLPRVSGKHLPRYLDEFVYRFDRRWREGELFGFVLQRAARGDPYPYHRLVAEAVG
jgi:hypothetical protein